MRILTITNHIPYPANSGYPLRVYNLLYRIAREHEIWLATFIPAGLNPNYISHLQKFCQGIETAVFQNQGALSHPAKALKYFIKGVPPDLRMYESRELASKIRCLITQVDFDIVQIEDSHMCTYLDILPKVILPRTLLTFHDVNFRKSDRLIQVETKNTRKARIWLHSRMMRRWEPFYAERFGGCIVVSESDRRVLLSSNPRLKIDVVPNGVDTNLYQPLPYSKISPALIFVGNMEYRPNIDAMIYFCRDIYPQLLREFSDLELWIVGINPSLEVKQLEGNGVHVTGCVEDVRPIYGRSTVCIIPLRAGGGSRLKILEAMALGRPVVSTSIGCEGLEVVDGKHLFIADTPHQFAEKTLSLLKDRELRQRIIAQARELVVSRYDWEVIAQQALQVYSRIAEGTTF
jgi:polysaccharide biosynthesis protein PslH